MAVWLVSIALTLSLSPLGRGNVGRAVVAQVTR